MKKYFLILLLALEGAAFAAPKPLIGPSLQTAKLTCEYIHNPLGIEMKSPRLSWTLRADKKNQLQSAYEIIVSNNLR